MAFWNKYTGCPRVWSGLLDIYGNGCVVIMTSLLWKERDWTRVSVRFIFSRDGSNVALKNSHKLESSKLYSPQHNAYRRYEHWGLYFALVLTELLVFWRFYCCFSSRYTVPAQGWLFTWVRFITRFAKLTFTLSFCFEVHYEAVGEIFQKMWKRTKSARRKSEEGIVER